MLLKTRIRTTYDLLFDPIPSRISPRYVQAYEVCLLKDFSILIEVPVYRWNYMIQKKRKENQCSERLIFAKPFGIYSYSFTNICRLCITKIRKK